MEFITRLFLLKQIIDSLPYAKIDLLQWHIVDDQSYALESLSLKKGIFSFCHYNRSIDHSYTKSNDHDLNIIFDLVLALEVMVICFSNTSFSLNAFCSMTSSNFKTHTSPGAEPPFADLFEFQVSDCEQKHSSDEYEVSTT